MLATTSAIESATSQGCAEPSAVRSGMIMGVYGGKKDPNLTMARSGSATASWEMK